MSHQSPPALERIRQGMRRFLCRHLERRTKEFSLNRAMISFTFDDFPKNAAVTGGKILGEFGIHGTYYASLGLMGKNAPTGRIFDPDDLHSLVASGHELGCHTFDHLHAWDTPAADFLGSTDKNRREIGRLIPDCHFETIAYPISCPSPSVKAGMSGRFRGCRGGGQQFNHTILDLNYLAAFFIEKCHGDIRPIKQMIDANQRAQGWLIFATHDISDHPTRFGCTPALFREIVTYSMESGATILPVGKALRQLA